MPDLPLPKPTSPNKQNTVSVSQNDTSASGKPQGAQSNASGDANYKPTNFSAGQGQSNQQPPKAQVPQATQTPPAPNTSQAPQSPPAAGQPAPGTPPTPSSPPPKPPKTITALNSMSAPAKAIPADAPEPAKPASVPHVNPAVSSQQPGGPQQPKPAAPTIPQGGATAVGSMQAPPNPSTPPAPGAVPSLGKMPAQPASPATTADTQRSAAFAKPKKSILRFLPMVIGALVLIGVIAFAAMQFLGGGGSTSIPAGDGPDTSGRVTVPGTQTTLTYWGLWEPSEVLTSVIEEFEAENPGITIEYSRQSHRDYRERLQTAVASGAGPDIFRFHASWTPMIADELSPLPATVLGSSQLSQNYYPAAAKQLVLNGNVVGVPLMYDGLALLYNENMLAAANEQPPTTWSELRALANKLTIRNGAQVQRAGIALGTAGNVEHFSDILAVLMLQNGANFTQPNSPETRDALLFYTNFARADRVWSTSLPASSTAFAREDVAMIFAPSWRIHEIQAQNPNLKFGVVPLPTLTDERITWASYWAEGISAQSQNKEAAQKFLTKLSSPETLQMLYSEQSAIRSFGELYPRQELADELLENSMIAPYLEDAPYAQGWYMSSSTHDNGINDQIIKYYADAVNAINNGEKPEDVLPVVDQGVKQVLRQYGVSTSTAR